MIRRRTLVILALATLLLVPLSHGKKSTTAKADFFPLRVGDSWTYKNTEEGGYTITVLSEEPQQGAPVRYVVEQLAGAKIDKVFSKSDGWVLFHSESYVEHEGLKATYEPPKQFLPNPLGPGQKWEWSGKDPAQVDHTETNRVVGFETVTVAAGKFRAAKIVTEITGTSVPMTRTTWYADGVGLVKSTTVGGQIKYGSELTDYSFKKK